MNYKFISIPHIWLSQNTRDGIVSTTPRNHHIFLTYNTKANEYFYTDEIAHRLGEEYLCNTEQEFLDTINQYKLENIL